MDQISRHPVWLRQTLVQVFTNPHPAAFFSGADLNCHFNQPLAQLFGLTADQAKSHYATDFSRFLALRSNDLHHLLQAAVRGRSGTIADLPVAIRHQGVTVRRHYTVTAIPVLDPDGTVVGAVSWGQDLTPIRAIGTDLTVPDKARDIARLGRIVEGVPAFTAMLDGPDHVVRLTNAAMRRLAGNRKLVGNPLAKGMPEAVTPGFVRMLDRSWATGRPLSFRSRRVVIDSGSGPESRYLTFVVQPVRDMSGEITALFIQGNDITDSVLTHRREEVAKRRNAHFAAVVASSAEAMVSFDLDGRILSWNPAAESIYGYSRDEAIGRCVSIVIPPERRGELAVCIEQVKAGRVYSLESLRLRRNGDQFRAMINVAPILNDRNQVVAVSVTSRDITEKHQALEALRESEARFRAIADQVPVIMWLTNADGHMEYVNKRWREFLYHMGPTDPNPVLNDLERGWLGRVHPNDLEGITQTFVRAHRQRTAYRFEFRMMRGDGGWRWMLDTGVPRYGANGEFLGLGGASIDITYLRKSEQARAAIDDQFRKLVNLAPTIVWEAAADGGLIKINDRWRKYSGQPMEQTLGDSWQEALHPDDAAGLYKAWADRSDAHGLVEHEVRLKRYDGVYRWFMIRATALHDFEGELTGWIGVTDDIHDHKSAQITLREEKVTLEARVAEITAERERALSALLHAQKAEALGQMTGGVAHDFNNLLQAITNCLAMIEIRVPDNDHIRPILDAGCQAVERGAKLVQQLMAFARRQALHPQALDLRDRVLAMSDLMTRSVRADVSLKTALSHGLWPVEVDTTQLELAILNLVVNARDAMPDGGSLRLSACNVTLPDDGLSIMECATGLIGQFVRLSVRDTGIGMPREVLDRAFDPYFTTKEVGKGSGLGLSQVFGFARQAGGAVWIDSEEGRGTTIHLLLPRSLNNPVKVEVNAPMITAGAVRKGFRILVVEDDPIVAMTVTTALEDAGFFVEQAVTADEALPIAMAGSVDLVFSDIVMPGRMNGIDLAQEIRGFSPKLPVVLATGYSENVVRIEGVRVIPKPYRIDQLLAVLDSVLSGVATA